MMLETDHKNETGLWHPPPMRWISFSEDHCFLNDPFIGVWWLLYRSAHGTLTMRHGTVSLAQWAPRMKNVEQSVWESISVCPQKYSSKILHVHGPHYAKRSLMSWVVVIPKEGWARDPSFGMTPTFPKKKSKLFSIFFQKNLKSRCHTKRRMGAAMHAPPSLWQGLRRWGTFSLDPAHLYSWFIAHLWKPNGCFICITLVLVCHNFFCF